MFSEAWEAVRSEFRVAVISGLKMSRRSTALWGPAFLKQWYIGMGLWCFL